MDVLEQLLTLDDPYVLHGYGAETGCPPKVEPCMNIGSETDGPPKLEPLEGMGATAQPGAHLLVDDYAAHRRVALVTPLAKVLMSGTTSKRSMPNHSPSRPKAQITASETSSTPWRSQISRTRFQ